jgi:prepilin-type processing-associated H-X9-DG protein
MYLSSYRVNVIPEHGNDVSSSRWWEVLSPYIGNSREVLLCPDAREPRAGSRPPDGGWALVTHGTALAAWQSVTIRADRPGGARIRNDYLGSYGLNVWVYHHGYPNMQRLFIRMPSSRASRVPLLGDCLDAWAAPTDGDAVPQNLIEREKGANGGIAAYCINRHQMAVNIVFLDGHAERVLLADLWQQMWTESFVPRSVVVPAP